MPTDEPADPAELLDDGAAEAQPPNQVEPDARPAAPALPTRLDPRREPTTVGTRFGLTKPIAPATRSTGRTVALAAGRALAAVLAIVLVVGAGLATTAVTRITSKSGTAVAPDAVSGNVAAPASDSAADIGEDTNILVVGNDSREGYTKEQLAELGTGYDPTLNTDTIILIHIPASGAKASIVSFPRDSYVSIPGYGKNKINSAYADGYYSVPESASAADKEKAAQAQVIATVSQLSGLQIDHYVEITLLGFLKLTQQIGGVEVTLCDDTSDPNYTGLKLSKGTHTLQGIDALRFVRQRHGLPNGDLDRIQRQQYFIGAVIRKLLGQNFLDLLNLTKLNQLIDALAGTITFDPGLDPLALAEQMRKIGAGDVEFRTVPLNPAVFGQVPGAGDVVLLASPDQLKTFFQNLNAAVDAVPTSSAPPKSSSSSSAPPTVPPAQVAVDVYNATGTKGVATTTATALQNLGFQVASTNIADQVQAGTTVTYASGMEKQANTLLSVLPGATAAPDPNLPAGTVRLLVGTGFAGVGQSAGSSAPAPTSAAVPPPQQTAAAGGCVN